MSNEFSIGDRLLHPKMNEWGIGQVVNVNSSVLTVFFEKVGEKKIRIDIVELQRLAVTEAESAILDAKFKAKRQSKQRRFNDPRYYNSGKTTSRKQFIESQGATCANWNWSWSFINREEKKIIFGAWQDLMQGNRALIFSNEWKKRRNRNQSPWPESRENIRLIEEEGYSLHVYTMIMDPDFDSEWEQGRRKIGAILNDVTEAELLNEGDNWFAVFSRQAADD